MFFKGQFLTSCVSTLYVIGVVVALVGIAFIINRVWRLSRPLRECLPHSWIARLIREMGTFLGATIAHAKSFAAGLLVALFIRSWQTFIPLLATLGNTLRQVPWGTCIGVLVAGSLPFLMFVAEGVSLQSIIGIAAAGALIGMLCAPFTGWHYRRLAASRALGMSLLMIIGGAWGSSMLIATLIAMASG